MCFLTNFTSSREHGCQSFNLAERPRGLRWGCFSVSVAEAYDDNYLNKQNNDSDDQQVFLLEGDSGRLVGQIYHDMPALF